MPAQCRVGDTSKIDADAHGCPACAHTCVGPAVTGSSDVKVNGEWAVRFQDTGVHAACCGPNTWTASNGSDSVYINGRPAHRVGDDDEHCGGMGAMIAGSPDVFCGGGKTDVVEAEYPPVPHDRTYTIELTDALGRQLEEATAIIRCPHKNVRQQTFTGTATLSGLCDGTTIEVQHPGEEAEWHLGD